MKTKYPLNHFNASTLLALATIVYPLSTYSQGTAFTYQGRLFDNTSSAGLPYDFRFGLFDAPTGGNQIGPILTNSAVNLSNGLFTVVLDFGNSVFTGAARWLEIGVRTNGFGAPAFSTLSPRQQLTAAPYAITSLNFNGTVQASQLAGTLASASLSGTYGNAVALTNPANTFTGNGAGLTSVNAVTICGVPCASLWQLAGKGVNDLAGLRGMTGSPGSAILMAGYYTPGDGGGGPFYWDPTSSTGDNGATVVVPSGSTTGRWLRIHDGQVNVKWFGAKGDGTNDDTAAIQAALNFAPASATGTSGFSQPGGFKGSTVYVPPGVYNVNAPALGVAALNITSNNVCLVGSGSPTFAASLYPQGGSFIQVTGPGTGLSVEGYTEQSEGSQIRNLTFMSGSTQCQDLLVIHAEQCKITDCTFFNAARFGVVIESGGGIVLGPSNAVNTASGGWFADFWKVEHCSFVKCGSFLTGGGIPLPSGTNTGGAGLYVYGNDSNGGMASDCVAYNCNIGFEDHSLEGCTWLNCYTEGNAVGYLDCAAGSHLYIGCLSEDVAPFSHYSNVGGATNGGFYSIAIGGSLSAGSSLLGTAPPSRINGVGDSSLGFETTMDDGSDLTVNIAHASNTPLDFTRTPASGHTSTWLLEYNPYTSADFPYTQGEWIWHYLQDHGQALDVYTGPFGWTDAANSLGAGLGIIGNPLVNTQHHWSFKQAGVLLSAGQNTVYCNGGSTNGGGFLFADDATAYWTNANTKVSVSAEFDTVSNMAAAGTLNVNGYVFTTEPNGRNIAASITVASSCTVTLVWTFDAFVRNGSGKTPN